MHRRDFLLGSLAGLSAVAVEAGPRKPPAVSFAFSLYGMRSLRLDEALPAVMRCGYDAVELAVMPEWPGDPARLTKEDRARLRRQLRDFNLALPALMENTPLQVEEKVHRRQLERLQAAAELGHALSPDRPPLIETILGGAAGAWDKLRRQFADRLADWAKIGEKTRTVIAIKPHRMNAMNLPEHALWLLDQVKSPWIKLGYDYSHFQFRDLTMEATLKAMLPETRFVHVKDVRLEKDRVAFLFPGEGSIDYVSLFTQLHKGKYEGCICVEVSGMISSRKDYDPRVAARRCYDSLAPALRKAGLR